MFTKIQQVDPKACRIASDDGEIYLSPGLQGRIFASIDDQLLHKLDFAMAASPDPKAAFNNLGGNSLWPAPEGGEYAFNYLPEAPEVWLVQDGIGKDQAVIMAQDEASAKLGKLIRLRNRRNADCQITFERTIMRNELAPTLKRFGLKGIGYHSVDSLMFAGECPVRNVLLNAWSLEQFNLNEGTVAFGKVGGDPAKSINDDFYGDAQPRLSYDGKYFVFRLGGENRLQIGIRRDEDPQILGAYDPVRNLIMLRRTERKEGLYINIADNNQPKGPMSTADMYSVFNGATLGFFELETIAPMILRDGMGIGSVLESDSYFYQGSFDALAAMLDAEYDIDLSVIIKHKEG